MTSLKYWDGSTWQYLPMAGLNVYEQPGDPGVVTVGSVWIDTDDAPPTSPLGPTLVTALPASPVDGQEVYWNNSTAVINGSPQYSVLWNLRFSQYWKNQDGYGWMFVGGSPIWCAVAADETYSSPSGYVDASTGGPAINLPLGGIWTVSFSASGYQSAQTAAGTTTVGLGIGGAQPTGAFFAQGNAATGAGWTATKVCMAGPVASGTQLRMMYNAPTALGGTPHIRWRDLQVLPVRVA